jgi:hypothetical protein
VKGTTPFIELLPYWRWDSTHLLDYMHIVKNMGQAFCDLIRGKDLNDAYWELLVHLRMIPNSPNPGKVRMPGSGRITLGMEGFEYDFPPGL